MARAALVFSMVVTLALGCGKPPEVKPEPPKDGANAANGGGVDGGGGGGLNAPAPQVPAPVAPQGFDTPAARPSASNVAKAGELPEPEPGHVWFSTDVPEPEYLPTEPDPNAVPPGLAQVEPPPSNIDSSTFAVVGPAGGGTGAGGTGGAGAGGTTGGANTAANAASGSFTLPDGCAALPEFGYSADGAPLRIKTDKDGATMAYIPADTIRLGLKSGSPEVTPELAVPLDAFYIDVTEVTVGQYEAYRNDLKDNKKILKPQPLNHQDPADFPVRGLPWGEAKTYAVWAGKLLPTEAQWEMAARGPKGYLHPWGNGKTLWPKARKTDEITAVKSYRTDQSPFGVFDLAGNVREWTADLFSATAFKDHQNTAVSQLKNWEGPKKGASDGLRVVKGNGPDWTVWHRAGVNQSNKAADVGFRCVITLKPSEKSTSKKK